MINSLAVIFSKSYAIRLALKQHLPWITTPDEWGGRTSKHAHFHINQEIPRRPKEKKVDRGIAQGGPESQHLSL
jgi:hypothetical protein